MAPVILLSGPSGSGKSTVVKRLLETSPRPLRLSVSATTRAPRPGELDGVHYHFWTVDAFRAAVARQEFVEWAEVHGQFYGTLKSELDPYREQGIGVILEVDVQGAEQVRPLYPDHVSIFLHAPGENYEQRLRDRGTETEEQIQHRLARVRRELERAGEYQFQLVNQTVEATVQQIQTIIENAFQGRSACSTN